jgi:TonB family protein
MDHHAILWMLAAVAAGQGGPEPIGNFQYSFTTADYPHDAIIQRMEGSVAYQLLVMADGSASTCRITESSGYPLLDETTCTLMSRRGHFTPARDEKGEAIPSYWNGRMTWKIPKPLSFAPEQMVTEFDVTADGRIENCTGRDAMTGSQVASLCADVARKAAINGVIPSVARHIRMLSSTEVSDKPAH